MLFDRPRNWKWLVPGALVSPCLVWWSQWEMAEGWQRDWALVPMTLTILLGIAAVVNLVLYVYYYSSQFYSDTTTSQNNTPDVRMFEAARGMHPDAVKALLVHRRTIWRLKYIPIKDLVDWVLDEAPNVHAGFVDFVFDNSSSVSLMPKRMLSQGSKQFDPDDIVTDYEQYDHLVLLMQQKLMITKAFGNQAPQWIPPYTKELARHRFGLDEAVHEEPEGLLNTVREQAAAGNVRVSTGDVPLSQSLMDKLPKKAPTRTPANGDGQVDHGGPVLTDEEWDAVQRIEAAHREKYAA